MSFIWGVNTGGQLNVTVIKIHVCAVLYHLVSRALSCWFTLSYNTSKNAFKRFSATTSWKQPPIQSSKISKDKSTVIIVGTSCKHPSVSVSSSCWLFVLHSCANKFIIQWVTRTKWNTNSTQNPLKWQHKNTAVANADPTVTNKGRKLILRSFFFLL